MALKGVAVGVATVMLSGCMIGPDYQRPELEVPAQFIGTVEEGESLANLGWWELFQDPQLDELVRVALEQNRDLRAAVARVEEARALLGVTRADQFPAVDGAATAKGATPLHRFFLTSVFRKTISSAWAPPMKRICGVSFAVPPKHRAQNFLRPRKTSGPL